MSSLTWSLQALLIRHEAYVADAEEERKRMNAHIDELVMDKEELQAKNNTIIEENRKLLEQLESANGAVTESDTHIANLNATLVSTQHELQKLSNLARRTESLERELEQYEEDQIRLQASLAVKTESEKAANLRRQETERALAALEDQMEAIEREAREEREKHVEVVGRLERRRAVEMEMDTAMGRLNGSAASRTSNFNKHGSGVVTHFVKDILQDNANLQMSIVELRDMLATSNEQVEQLRIQLSEHSPLDDSSDAQSDLPRRSSTLSQEMARSSAQEVHVHHHYHAPGTAPEGNKRHSQALRKPKKKRNGITSGHFTPPSDYRTPKSSISSGPNTPFSAATSFASTPSLQIRPSQAHRWSMQSMQTISTIPSSPQSTDYQAPSLFDPPFSDAGMDSSRPTTPDSEAIRSPIFTTKSGKRMSTDSYRFDSRFGERPDSAPDRAVGSFADDLERHPGFRHSVRPDVVGQVDDDAIPEENEDTESPARSLRRAVPADIPSLTTDDLVSTNDEFNLRPLRRAASHESLLSVSGMDIHTLQSRPAQMLTGQPNRSFSSQPVVSATTAHAARPTLTQRNSDRNRSLLSGMAADQRQPAAAQTSNQGFGRKVGGWVFGRWGTAAAPVPSATTSVTLDVVRGRIGNDSTTSPPPPPMITRTTSTPVKGTMKPDRTSKFRPAGINQSGAILGLRPEPQISREPILRTLDEEALRQSLSEA